VAVDIPGPGESMKVLLFGATGMVGQGVLYECLRDSDVDQVISIGRRATGRQHEKLREIVQADLYDYSAMADQLIGIDACFFCLGVSSVGMSEADYSHVTYDLTMAAAELLARQNPKMTFIYVSGAGTDGTLQSRQMWARVKGKTENAVMALPFKGYAFRPGFIEPKHGTETLKPLYRRTFAVLKPILPVIKLLYAKRMTTTENIGLAMLELAKHGSTKRVIEIADIEELARRKG
jgi:uncharacterized protein YbjT (DUF2867 family)